MTKNSAKPILQAPAGRETLEAELRSAKRVLHLETQGLRALADDLGRPIVRWLIVPRSTPAIL